MSNFGLTILPWGLNVGQIFKNVAIEVCKSFSGEKVYLLSKPLLTLTSVGLFIFLAAWSWCLARTASRSSCWTLQNPLTLFSSWKPEDFHFSRLRKLSKILINHWIAILPSERWCSALSRTQGPWTLSAGGRRRRRRMRRGIQSTRSGRWLVPPQFGECSRIWSKTTIRLKTSYNAKFDCNCPDWQFSCHWTWVYRSALFQKTWRENEEKELTQNVSFWL